MYTSSQVTNNVMRLIIKWWYSGFTSICLYYVQALHSLNHFEIFWYTWNNNTGTLLMLTAEFQPVTSSPMCSCIRSSTWTRCTFILSMQASIFSCSTAFLAWEMLAVLLLTMPSFMVLRGEEAHMESMNIALNPQCSILPPSNVFASLSEQPSSKAQRFIVFTGPILSEGICYPAAELHFIWR